MNKTKSLIQCRSLDPDEVAMRLGRDEWRAEIVSSHPTLFQPPRGLPECRAGWEQLIDETCSKIEDALKPEEGDTLTVSRIIERCGRLHIFWEGMLSARARAEVEKAIESAIIASEDTCEICGGEGRLYSSDGWLLTACTGHGRGKPTSWKRGVGFVRVVRGIIDGKDFILSCREYEPKHDLFVDIPSESIAK